MPSARQRRDLVEQLRRRGALHDDAVARAFLRVPRETFVPGLPLDMVYRDDAIVTKMEDGIGVSSSSQPAVMALMLEQLDLFPGARVLEIGAGTGYNAALLRELVGPSGLIVTIDIDEEVAGWARERLDRAGYADVVVHCADGAEGWLPAAPYDRIELTVGASDIAPAWVEQLRDGGVLVLPLWLQTGQLSIAFEKHGGVLHSRSIEPCGFIQMRGQLGSATHPEAVAPGVYALVPEATAASRLSILLRTSPALEPWTTGAWDGFTTWAGLWGLPLIGVVAERDSPTDVRGVGFALLDTAGDGLALVIADTQSNDLRLRTYGDTAARERLLDALDRWNALGRPAFDRLHIDAYRVPVSTTLTVPPGAVVLDTRWWRFVCTMTDPLSR